MTEPGEDITVVVPTYNAEEHLDECLTSLRDARQPGEPVEIVVADGGSSDRTLEIARDHDAKVLVEEEAGVAEARNRAVEAVEADVVLFVDADCRAPEDLFTLALDRLAEHEAVGAFYEPAEDHGWVARTWLALESKPSGPVSWVPAGTLAVRREAFDAVDGFREDLGASEDVDLCRRLRAEGFTVYHEPAIACVHLGQADSISAFFSKEVWRSQSLLDSVRRSNSLDAEAVTAVLAFYHLLVPLGLFAAALVSPPALAVVVGLALAPSLAWAVYAAPHAGWTRIPQLFVLLLVYNAARATSLIKYRQFGDLN